MAIATYNGQIAWLNGSPIPWTNPLYHNFSQSGTYTFTMTIDNGTQTYPKIVYTSEINV